VLHIHEDASLWGRSYGVDSMIKEESVNVIDENNPVYIILILKQLLSLFMTITDIGSIGKAYELFSKMRIFKPKLTTVLFYFMRAKAATCKVALQDINFISEAQFYRMTRELRKSGLIEFHHKARSSRKGGPRSSVYAMPGATQDDVLNAIRKEHERFNPMYKTSARVLQVIMDDFIEPQGLKEFHFNQVRAVAKNFETDGFYIVDITKQVCKMLIERGVKMSYPAQGPY